VSEAPGAGVLQRNLGTDATRCASDQHDLVGKCLGIVVELWVNHWIDTWGGLSPEEGHQCGFATYSWRLVTLRFSSKPTIDIVDTVIVSQETVVARTGRRRAGKLAGVEGGIKT
jgi:hypothetical protein